ncbi:uncharacterized protein L3040_008278 [Drepanopeziza brunnea f. sp. 'multigermtubi']|uniref:Tat pathway signal sequence n=1 Tax=Marssonina brunnea f. sp. multigermtubi (strain MB_m1) TaxID=1072389 RepID=K1WAQ2_MARBU|nr:tat pathway signal sequence [Drepanopeziza brunnea f. sp. 'multigermtubi' MB_m1]EKD14365.1 tat pathway signal sequence [Drepanopeziza brunnea f. sp. 'multigermtubi' MB_m1]KAJ5035016.1 hypothetical protein L3040_008278 [Drepanopeziza brunnea f. sp. 'multigermtubi']
MSAAEEEVKVERLTRSPENKIRIDGANQASPPSKPVYTWQQSAEFGLQIQVETREKAVKAGLSFLGDLNTALGLHTADVPSAKKWIERIKQITGDRGHTRVLIGFLGTTGAGKSSMINALLEEEDLLPADDEKACTAVCVEISSNTEPMEAYRAKIERISTEDWKIELEKLFQDISDQALNKDGEDGEPDLERDMRIKTAFQKLTCVYPHIETIADLKSYTVSNLLNHPNIKDVLGKTRHIVKETLDEFAAAIKPYIDSSKSKQGGGKQSFAHWPLVKLVQLWVKSTILQHGIVLVDLPGSMDTNAARGAIAETYQKNLSVNCVVAPTTRAASDKPAQDLLGEVAQRSLQLDGKFSADSLCFIVSKTDSSLSMARYIKNHKNVEAMLKVEFEEQASLNNKLDRLRIHCAEKKKSQGAYEKLAKDLKKQMEVIVFKKSGSGDSPKKRKREDGEHPETRTPKQNARQTEYLELVAKIKEAKIGADKAGSSLHSATEKISALEQALKDSESRKLAVCVKNRNDVSATEIRRDFEGASKYLSRKGTGKQLQVFCVSAWAFGPLLRGEKAMSGFPKISDTGIPALQNWLTETTLPTRNRNALSFLDDIVSLELSMVNWLSDNSLGFKISNSERKNLDECFEQHFQGLQKETSKVNSQIVQKCKSTVEEGLFSQMVKVELIAGGQAEQTVKSWAQRPMHWSTHRACNRGQGIWKTVKGIEHNWIDKLAGIYLQPLTKDWDRTLHTKLPAQRTFYDDKISLLIQSFIVNVSTSVGKILPSLGDAVQQWKESSARSMVTIQKISRVIFDEDIQKVTRDSHRLVQPEIQRLWKPTFDKCGENSGPGHFKRNQQRHVLFVQKNGRLMYEQSSRAIKNSFEKLWEGLPANFDEGTGRANLQIQEEFKEMLANYTLHGDKESAKSVEASSKAHLQEKIRRLFNDLKTAWAETIEIPEVAEEVESEYEEIDIEGVLKDDEQDEEFIDLIDSSDED